jgi:hypothetical protein
MINPDLTKGARWRKSSRSGGEGTQCVELANVGAVRDSKNRTGPALHIDTASLLEAVKRGRFDVA